MHGSLLYQFIRYLMANIGARGANRVVYAVVNIFFMAAAGACVYGIAALAESMSLGVIVSIVCIVVLVIFALYLFVNGVVGQLVQMIMSAVFIADKEQRAAAIVAFLIALLSFVALGVAAYMLLG